MSAPAPPALLPLLERVLMRLAPQWALRRARARAALAQAQRDREHPENVRYIGGERWRRRASGSWELDPPDYWRRSS
jgi:hypothetical protein